MNQEQEKIFTRRMETLKKDPMFAPAKRSAQNNARFLIVSYGGTGGKALQKIRDTLKTYLNAKDYDDYVRILAIDTDGTAQYETIAITRPDGTTEEIKKQIFDNSEFCQLSSTGARDALDTDQVTLGQWINPSLPNMIKTDYNYLDGKGASATREVGRLTLYPQATNDTVRKRISALVGELTDGNADPLNVIVVSGISGGTGSGTIIDLTYLIRECIKGMSSFLYSRTKVAGMVLLPPTGSSNDPILIKRGNRNGYAALKEINHFMTLKAREDQYTRAYQGGTIQSDDNLFETCYLLDGRLGAVSLGAAAGEAVNNVVAQCILDMITSPSATAGGPAAFDSILSDAAASATAIISDTSDRIAPRDADYRYCTLGHCSTEIPLNAMKTYMAYKSYEQMYASFVKCGEVNQAAVEKFYKDVIDTKAPREKQANIIGNALTEIFQDKTRGPFYVINLLLGAVQFTRDQADTARAFRVRMADNAKLQQMQELFLKLNDQYFSVFTAVMETMRSALTEDYKTVINVDLLKTGNTRYYSFNPIHLGQLENGNAVADYLDGLVSPKRVSELTEALLNEIINNRDKWSDLIGHDQRDGTFEAPKRIREFWNIRMNKMLSASVEDFLIKWYSGNKNAYFDPQNPDATQPYLDKAAQEIFTQMFGGAGKAKPMAELIQNGPGAFETKYILVPKDAPNLMAALQKVARNSNTAIKIYKSTSSDRITGYAQYACLPAFKFGWVAEAEGNYEADIGSAIPGIHMSESPTGELWKEFPNLRPVSCLHLFTSPKNTNPRENALAARAEDLFTRAQACGMTVSTAPAGTAIRTYAVKLLPAALRPDKNLFRNLYSESDESRRSAMQKEIAAVVDSSAQTLFEKVSSWTEVPVNQISASLAGVGVAFSEEPLRALHEVYPYGANPEPDDWFEQLAARLLRRKPNTMYELEGSILVMEKLIQLVEAEQEKAQVIVDFAKYLAAEMIVPGDFDTWVYKNNGIDTTLEIISSYDDIRTTAKYFYLFEAMRKNYADVKGAVENDFIRSFAHNGNPQAQAESTKRMVEGLDALHEKVAKDFAVIGKEKFAVDARVNGEPVDEIRNFYIQFNQLTGNKNLFVKLIANLPNVQ